MEKLTVKIVEERLAEISIKCDDEVQHVLEDRLNAEFIDNILAGNYDSLEEIKEVGNAVIKVREMDFCRWYA